MISDEALELAAAIISMADAERQAKARYEALGWTMSVTNLPAVSVLAFQAPDPFHDAEVVAPDDVSHVTETYTIELQRICRTHASYVRNLRTANALERLAWRRGFQYTHIGGVPKTKDLGQMRRLLRRLGYSNRKIRRMQLSAIRNVWRKEHPRLVRVGLEAAVGAETLYVRPIDGMGWDLAWSALDYLLGEGP
jgi:hypothetical protein